MKNRTYTILIIGAIFVLMHFDVFAQVPYTTGIGIRGSRGKQTSGLSFKFFTIKERRKASQAIEAIVSRRYPNKFFLTALYEFQQLSKEFPGIHWVYGGGIHVGQVVSFKSEQTALTSWHKGIDVLVGIEFIPEGLPFSLGLDIKPYIDFQMDQKYNLDMGISIRFIF